MIWNNQYNSLMLNGRMIQRDELLELCDSIQTGSDENWIKDVFAAISDWLLISDHIILKTSGSTGTPKTIKCLKKDIVASALLAESFYKYQQNDTILLCISPNYIGGKMMIYRAFVSGLNLIIRPPSSRPLLGLDQDVDFAAMVPLQLEESLIHDVDEFEKVKQLIVGSAKVSDSLKSRLENIKTVIYECYGMTETLSHIANKRIPQEKHFKALPGISFELDERSCLRILTPHFENDQFQTNDLAELIDSNTFHWLGRYDNVINSGGFKISPEKLEETLRPYIDENFIFSSVPDDKLGEKLVLIIETSELDKNYKREIIETSKRLLDKYEVPKEIICMDSFSYTENDKLDRRSTKESLLLL